METPWYEEMRSRLITTRRGRQHRNTSRKRQGDDRYLFQIKSKYVSPSCRKITLASILSPDLIECVCAVNNLYTNYHKQKGKTNGRKHIYPISSCLFGRDLGRRNTDAVGVAVEQDALALTGGTLGGLNPLASAGTCPESLQEASPSGLGLGTVVVAHDALDGLAGLIGVVEGDVADIVMQNVGLNDTVEDVAADKAEVTVDGSGGTTGKVPNLRLVVRKGGVGVLQESDGDWKDC